jgi:hypothetical protein
MTRPCVCVLCSGKTGPLSLTLMFWFHSLNKNGIRGQIGSLQREIFPEGSVPVEVMTGKVALASIG